MKAMQQVWKVEIFIQAVEISVYVGCENDGAEGFYPQHTSLHINGRMLDIWALNNGVAIYHVKDGKYVLLTCIWGGDYYTDGGLTFEVEGRWEITPSIRHLEQRVERLQS